MTSTSNNVYIDKLDGIIDEHNNTYHRTIKMKPVAVKDNTYIDFEEEVNDKVLNLKLVILLEFVNTKIFLLMDIPQIGKVKNTVPCY